ncbi:MAG: hypothetical protein RR415_11145, partial [Ruthenibacterium sp.]
YMTGVLNYNAGALECISPSTQRNHYFYGYYDNPALTQNDTLHLCNHVAFMNRLPNAQDENELGYIELDSKEFHPFAKTTAWNFQQGTMLQWLPKNNLEVIYNNWTGCEYESIVQNVVTGTKRHLSAPIANVSPDGKWGIALNFNRIRLALQMAA